MRRLITVLFCCLFMLPLIAGGNSEVAVPENTQSTAKEEKTMTMTINGRDYSFTLSGTSTAASLSGMLPLELSFEDFAGTEKISYTPQRLSVSASEMGHAPAAGDLCVYVPWGNLCLFYKDYHYSDELVFVGRVEEGIEEIAAISGGFSAGLR